MKLLQENLIKEERYLKELIAVIINSLREAPEGNLRISRSGKSVQYYYKPPNRKSKNTEKINLEVLRENFHDKESENCDSGLETKNQNSQLRVCENEIELHYLKCTLCNVKTGRGVYIRKSDEKLAHDIAQRDYDNALLKVLRKRLDDVRNLLEQDQNDEAEQVFDTLHPFRKEIVQPRIMTDEKYIEKWNSVQYEGKSFSEDSAMMYTNRGERVRSKSEKIIADMLLQNGVPYRYEAPVTLFGIGIVYPDFTILNIKKRENIYWEHLGMMDKQDYCEHALRKIEMYQRSGIILGRTLIITYETSRHPLETQMIMRNIAEYCLS